MYIIFEQRPDSKVADPWKLRVWLLVFTQDFVCMDFFNILHISSRSVYVYIYIYACVYIYI